MSAKGIGFALVSSEDELGSLRSSEGDVEFYLPSSTSGTCCSCSLSEFLPLGEASSAATVVSLRRAGWWARADGR